MQTNLYRWVHVIKNVLKLPLNFNVGVYLTLRGMSIYLAPPSNGIKRGCYNWMESVYNDLHQVKNIDSI